MKGQLETPLIKNSQKDQLMLVKKQWLCSLLEDEEQKKMDLLFDWENHQQTVKCFWKCA